MIKHKKEKTSSNETHKKSENIDTEKKQDNDRKIMKINQLFDDNKNIVKKLDEINEHIEEIGRINKKFLIAATMGDEKTEHLEKTIYKMKMGVIKLLDEMYVLIDGINSSRADDLKEGVPAFKKTISEIIKSFDIEEIAVDINMLFDPRKCDCKGEVCLDVYEDEVIVEVVRPGYIDKESGDILRYAQVIVNKTNEKEKLEWEE